MNVEIKLPPEEVDAAMRREVVAMYLFNVWRDAWLASGGGGHATWEEFASCRVPHECAAWRALAEKLLGNVEKTLETMG